MAKLPGGKAGVTAPAFIFGVDLDGVCADFYQGIKPIAAEWLGVAPSTLTDEVGFGFPEWGLDREPGAYEDLHRFAISQRDLFRRLAPMRGAARALRHLSARGIRIRIITHRLFINHFHQQAISQTVAWLDEHGFPYWDLCFMQDKAAVGADLYIDDSPANISALVAAGHRTIAFTNSTNREVSAPLRAGTWDEVERIVISEQAAWRKHQRGRRRISGR